MMDNNEVNWGEVIDFFSKKYISLRAMLMGSEISVENDNINVMLKSKGKFMLEQKNANKTISEFLHNTTGKTYSIAFLEPDKIEQCENKEETIIKNILAENAKLAEEHAKNPPKEAKQDIPNMKMGFAPKQNSDNAKPNFVPQQNWNNNQNAENKGEKRAPRKRSMAYIENEENLIYKGYRDTKDPKDVKIINLSPEQPGVIIKGKISNYDSR